MKKTICCIFAHPDDEAFGPAGTIYKLAQENDVYILCATKGEAGEHHGGPPSRRMDEVRANELKNSAEILGVKQVFFMGFKDGTLCNNLYHSLAEKLKKRLDVLRPEMLITYEPRGVSGHIDHIMVSMVSSYLFTKLEFIKTLHYYCLSDKQSWTENDYYIYFPPGYKQRDIEKVVDVADVWEFKKQAMYRHKSQRADADMILARYESIPKKEHFMVINK